MINATEIRLGNWLEYLGVHCQVGMNILYAVGKIVPHSVMYKPIPLTNEILEKCGFKRGFENINRNCFYSTGIHKIDLMITTTGNFLLGGHIVKGCGSLLFFHQLQNIYQSLTGLELNYTP